MASPRSFARFRNVQRRVGRIRSHLQRRASSHRGTSGPRVVVDQMAFVKRVGPLRTFFRAASILIWLESRPHANALRLISSGDMKYAAHLKQKASSGALTSYGQPAGAQLLYRETAVDHFGKAQYTGNDTYQLRLGLIWPETEPNDSTPIFLFVGEETPIEQSAVGAGFYADLANSVGALQIWPEHRYYAESLPFLPNDDLQHLSIEQAMVDHVELVLYLQNLLSMDHNPVIAIGSSYSAQLASYMRMRYPDVIAGAIASSPTSFGCPGLGLDPSYDPYGYAKVATRAASSKMGSAAACPDNVQNFFKTLFALAMNSSGLDQINTDMKLCPDSMVKTYDQAQYNAPVAVNNIPANRVSVACGHLSNSSLTGTDLLAAMTQAIDVFSQNSSSSCLDTTSGSAESEPELFPGSAQAPSVAPAPAEAASAGLNSAAGPPEPVEEEPAPEAAGAPELSATQKFGYQICTQDTTPASYNGVTDMFYNVPYSVQAEDEACVMQFGVHSQYNWAAYNFGLNAIRQSSNIFFTQGLSDPFLACGPTVNISDSITVAIHDSCHAYDVGTPVPEDSPSVVSARQQGAANIAKWVQEYNMLKASTSMSNPADLFDLEYALGGYIAKINDTMIGSQVFTNQSVLKPDKEYISVGQII